MPELPEVETMVRDLTPRLAGRRIHSVQAAFEGSVRYPDFTSFVDRVREQAIREIGRRGKYATFLLGSGDVLIVHRGMTGALLHRQHNDSLESHVRLTLLLDDGSELRFKDPRKFGKIYLMSASGEERPLPWATMGPEPLSVEFTAADLGRSLFGRKGLLKPILLNQRIVAGLGNIYADEALFLAGIHPRRQAGSLSEAEVTRLHAAIIAVLDAAIKGRGTTFSSYTDIEGRDGNYQRRLQVFGRKGEACPHCTFPIEKFVVGGRGTHICPRCQVL